MSIWSFRNPVEIQFGANCVRERALHLSYRRSLLVTTAGMSGRSVFHEFIDQCSALETEVCNSATSNPELSQLDDLAERYRNNRFDSIIAFGGGSVIDTAKVLSVLLGSSPAFSLEKHFYHGMQLETESGFIPVIAVPTTSGTGSEVTPFATVWDASAKKKYSLNHSRIFPAVALLDPSFTEGLPWEVTVSTGLDALCQGLESLWNRNATSASSLYSTKAILDAWIALRQGKDILESLELRSQLMRASLFAGIAISQTRTALCHSISYPLTAHLNVPHGLACGATIPEVLDFNSAVDDGRLKNLVSVLNVGSLHNLCSQIEDLLETLGANEMLRVFVQSSEQVLDLVPEMITPERAGNNLREAGYSDIEEILRKSLSRALC